MKTLEWEGNKLKLIDQRKLPDELTHMYCDNYQDVIVAIKNMTVRGAPAIGVAAAFGMALADIHGVDLDKAADEIKSARPTAVNLFWAVDRVLHSKDVLSEALKMYEENMMFLNISLGLISEAFKVPMLQIFKLIGCPSVLIFRIANTSRS